VVDGLDQAEGGHLVEILEGLATAAEADRDPLRHGQPQLHQLVPQRLALRALRQQCQALERRVGVGGVVMRMGLGSGGDGHVAHLPERVLDGQTPWEESTRTKNIRNPLAGLPRGCLLSEALLYGFPLSGDTKQKHR